MAESELQSSGFKEQCVEHFSADGSTFISVVFDKSGDALATRTMNMGPQNPHMTIDFKLDDQRYELKHTPAAGAEIFLDGLDGEGNRKLTKIESSTDEYKKALDTAVKIGFETLPACTIE